MVMAISRRDIDRAHSAVARMQRDAERSQAMKETYVGQLTQSLEIGAGALASGMLSGRFGALSVGPIPLDLLSALGLHALGFAGLLGKYSDDAHNVGDGMLAAYLVKLGAGLGTTMRISAGQSPFTTGNDPAYAACVAPAAMGQGYNAYAQAYQGGGLSVDELAAMAAMG